MAPKRRHNHHHNHHNQHVIPAAKLGDNTLQAEDLFQKGSGFGGNRVLTQKQQSNKMDDEPEEMSHSKEGRRRQTRSSSGVMSDEWIKVPVEVPLREKTGEWLMVTGVVFYSLETKKLYRTHDLVYVEATVSGAPAILTIPEAQLPMMTGYDHKGNLVVFVAAEDHPEFAILSKRLREELRRRRENARLLRDLQLENENEAHDAEMKMAAETFERDMAKLKANMLQKSVEKLGMVERMMKQQQGQEDDEEHSSLQQLQPQPQQKEEEPQEAPLAAASGSTEDSAEPVQQEDEDEAVVVMEDPDTPEEAKARRVLHEMLRRPTLQPPRPWAPVWDSVPPRKRKAKEKEHAKAENDFVRDEEYVDMLELVKRRAGYIDE